MIELLAPAGSYKKAMTAFHFGADAIYVGGKSFSLRAFADNFTDEELKEIVKYAHSIGKKVYVTLNIFPKNEDLIKIEEYLKYLDGIKADGVIASDAGVLNVYNRLKLSIPLHLSTQANTTNSESAKFWVECGAKRLILARELSFKEICEIAKAVEGKADVEIFVHGAMCISYSGRCLLSNYLTKRNSNYGECVQACRWEYSITEKSRQGEKFQIEEDERGTYILNSKDLKLIEKLPEILKSNIASLKIEGRMKSEYYVATVVNAYRRAIDYVLSGRETDKTLISDLDKAGHREYTTAFFDGKNDETVNLITSKPDQTYDFIAEVADDEKDGLISVVMRNRFKVGDELEVLSNGDSFNKSFTVEKIVDEKGGEKDDAKLVEEKLTINCPYRLKRYDILRRKKLDQAQTK